MRTGRKRHAQPFAAGAIRQLPRKAGADVTVVRIRAQGPRELHGHDRWELVIVLAGTGIHRTNAEDRRIAAGDAFAITPGELHAYAKVDRLQLVNVLLPDPDRLVPVDEQATLPGWPALFREAGQPGVRLDIAGLAQVCLLVDDLEMVLRRQDPGWRSESRCLLIRMLISLARRAPAAGDAPQPIAQLLAWMARNSAAPIHVAAMARRLGWSANSLLRAFRRATGTSPKDHLIGLRLAEARRLLADSRFPISTVAGRCGFEDPSYFARVFRRRLGLTPQRWRERQTQLRPRLELT